jgi:Fe-S cluster biogenesis protein NfuA
MESFSKEKLIEKVDTALDEVRPHLAVDGGNIEVVDVTQEGVVKIRWLGTCENCSMSAMTMKAGVEETIKSKLPGIKEVIAVNGAFSSELPSV